jgi:Flp pilus assembly protein TadG
MKHLNNIKFFSRYLRTPVRREEAAELVECALVLPILLVLLVGLLDFANAYNLKQKLSNAAREGARLGSSDWADVTQTSPASNQAIHDAVVTYLSNTGVNTSFIGSTMTSAGDYTWTYYSTGTYGLEIERDVQVPTSGGVVLFATRITLTYPYSWTFGFNTIIKLLLPSANVAGTVSVPADATMQNIS